MYKLLIPLRYFRRNWLNIVGVLSVAIAVMVPICVLSVMKGFDDELRERTRDTLADLIIEPYGVESFEGYEDLIERIEKLQGVVSAAPEYSGLALVKMGTITRYAQFRGIDLAKELTSTDFADYYRRYLAQEARQQLTDRMTMTTVPPKTIPADELKSIASRLRRVDFELLADDHSALLERSAKAAKVDLDPLFVQAEKAVPSWPTVPNPQRETPAFVGSEMAVVARAPGGRFMRIARGNKLVLIIPTALTESARVFQRCRVAGYFKSGLSTYDNQVVIVPLTTMQKRLDKDGHVTQINVRLRDFAHAPAVRAVLWGQLTLAELREGMDLVGPMIRRYKRKAYDGMRDKLRFLADNPEARSDDYSAATKVLQEALRMAAGVAMDQGETWGVDSELASKLKGLVKSIDQREARGLARSYSISTWQDKRRTFLRAVQVERRVMAFILFFITIVAGFLIFFMLHTTVYMKTKDIGILRSIGASPKGVMGMFLVNGTLIGLIGALGGMSVGLFITYRLNAIENLLSDWVGFRLFPRDIYFFDQIPVEENPLPSAIAIGIIAVIVSFFASAIPAWKAARMNPVESLRYE